MKLLIFFLVTVSSIAHASKVESGTTELTEVQKRNLEIHRRLGRQIMHAEQVKRENEYNRYLDENIRLREEMSIIDREMKEKSLKGPSEIPKLVKRRQSLEEKLRANEASLRSMTPPGASSAPTPKNPTGSSR